MLRTGVIVVACAAALRRLQKLSISSAKRKANEGRSISSPDETGASAFVLTSSRKVQLYCRRWGTLNNPTAAVILVHGELLSSASFQPLAEKLAENGFVCYGLDLTGFGKSGCQQGIQSHIDSYKDYLADMDVLIETAKAETNGAPVVIYGEGLGGTCALAYALSEPYKDKVATVVAVGTKLQPSLSADCVERGFYKAISKVLPAYPGPRETPDYDIAELFGNEEIGVLARSNFEKMQPASIKKIQEISKLCDFVQGHLEALSVPLLILHGTADKRVEMKQAEELKLRAGSKAKYLRPYPDVQHGLIYHSPATLERVVVDMVAFLSNNLPSPRERDTH